MKKLFKKILRSGHFQFLPLSPGNSGSALTLQYFLPNYARLIFENNSFSRLRSVMKPIASFSALQKLSSLPNKYHFHN